MKASKSNEYKRQEWERMRRKIITYVCISLKIHNYGINKQSNNQTAATRRKHQLHKENNRQTDEDKEELEKFKSIAATTKTKAKEKKKIQSREYVYPNQMLSKSYTEQEINIIQTKCASYFIVFFHVCVCVRVFASNC